MAAIDKAALTLTQCWTCLGCNRLEDEKFRGDDKCKNYRKADMAQHKNASTDKQQAISLNYTGKDIHSNK